MIYGKNELLEVLEVLDFLGFLGLLELLELYIYRQDKQNAHRPD